MPGMCGEDCVPYLRVALPSSMRPCFMSSNSFRDSAAGRSLQGLGLLSSLHSTRGLMVHEDQSVGAQGLRSMQKERERPSMQAKMHQADLAQTYSN